MDLNSSYQFRSPDISRKNETHDELGNLQKQNKFVIYDMNFWFLLNKLF